MRTHGSKSYCHYNYEWEAIKTQSPEFIRTDFSFIISRYIYVPREFNLNLFLLCVLNLKKHNLDFIVFFVKVRFASQSKNIFPFTKYIKKKQ